MHMIHITPQIIAPYFLEPELIDIEIPELDLTLLGRKDLDTRNPYPNKKYFVGCRKKGRKAVSGLLIESPIFLKEYTVISRWNWTGHRMGGNWMESDEIRATHIVKNVVLDNDFDMTSDDMVMWYGTPKFENRCPEWVKLHPLCLKPCMDFNSSRKRAGEYEDEYHSISGHIIKRTEIFKLPTIKRERYLCWNSLQMRMPEFGSAFAMSMKA